MPQPPLATFTVEVAAHDADDEPRAEAAFRDLLVRVRNEANRLAATYPDLDIAIWLEPAPSDVQAAANEGARATPAAVDGGAS